MNVERQLLDHGKVSRGRLGVMIQEVNQQLADTFGLDKPVGALVSSVEKDSPAEKAGIESGDIILKFNGKDIVRSSDLPPLVSALTLGVSTDLKIWRKGKARELSMNVGEMKVASVERLQALVEKENKRAALLILRGRQTMFVPLNLG